ncbi:spermatogenesis-associated protein 31D1-like isoform X3 [Saccopteryx bilineata]|uniref:spermatogenesis-associated protein 31D1-like isoform X3 n=1 Tax=Saccopteryx bilineata TaxID=59482 RepID=UPI00338EF064
MCLDQGSPGFQPSDLNVPVPCFIHCVITDRINNLIYICVLLLFLDILLLGLVSALALRNSEHTQKHRSRAKRRRKGGTREAHSSGFSDWRNYNREEEEKRELISIIKSPLGQHHDTVRFYQLPCPGPSWEVCNNTTAYVNHLPSSEALEDSTPSVSPLASPGPMTERSSSQSSAFSAVPSADITPPPLPKPFSSPPSNPAPNPVTTLGNFQSPSPPGHTLPPEPFPPSECKLPVHHSPPQTKESFSSHLDQYNFHQESPDRHSTQNSFGRDPEAKLIDPGHLFFLSPDKQDSEQHCTNPRTGEDDMKQESVQLSWGLPSPHSESLTSPVQSSDDYSSIFVFNSLANASTGPESPILPYVLPPSLPEAQPQPLPQTMPQSRSLPLTQIQPQAPLQSPLPVLPSSPIPQIRAYGVCFDDLQNKSELLTSSKMDHLEQNILKKQRESVWGLPSVADVSISIYPMEFYLRCQIQKTLEHHIRKRLIQHRWGLPLRILEILSLMRPLRNSLAISESKSCYGHSQISMYKSPSRNNLNVRLRQPGSFYKKGSEMFHLEENKGTEERDSQEDDADHLSSHSHSSSDKDVGCDSHTNLDISREHSVVSGPTASHRKQANGMKVHLNKKLEAISKGQTPGTEHSSMHTMKQTPSIKSQTGIEQTSLPPSMDLNCSLNVSQELFSFESTTEQILEFHIKRFHTRMLWGHPAKVPESVKHFINNTSSHSLINSNFSSSTSLISKIKSQPGGFIPLRGGSKSLHEEKEYSATILNLPVSADSFVGKESLYKINNLPQATMEVSPTDSQSEKFSGGDTGIKASELKKKTFLTQDAALEEMQGGKFPQTLSQKDQSPDSLFTKRMKRFFKKFIPRLPQRISQGNGSPVPAQSRGPVKRRAAFTGVSDTGKSLEEKAGHQDALGSSRPREPPPSTAKFGKAEQKAAVRACPQPVQGLPPNSRAASSKATITKSCSQAALFAGQSSTTSSHTRNEDRQAQIVVALKEQQPLSVPYRGTVPHPRPTCRPPDVPRAAKGSVQGKNIPTPK